jgi:hypothetical protein
LAYHDGYIYALTGYLSPNNCADDGGQKVIYRIPVGLAQGNWTKVATINGDKFSDGFTTLVNRGVVTFLINDGDASCTYREYSITGVATGNSFTVPTDSLAFCTGVDTADIDTGAHFLFFARGSNNVDKLSEAGLTVSIDGSWSFSVLNTVSAPPGSGWEVVEDISLVHGFVGTPGVSDCKGTSISDNAQRYNGSANAASMLGYASLNDYLAAVTAYCATP